MKKYLSKKLYVKAAAVFATLFAAILIISCVKPDPLARNNPKDSKGTNATSSSSNPTTTPTPTTPAKTFSYEVKVVLVKETKAQDTLLNPGESAYYKLTFTNKGPDAGEYHGLFRIKTTYTNSGMTFNDNYFTSATKTPDFSGDAPNGASFMPEAQGSPISGTPYTFEVKNSSSNPIPAGTTITFTCVMGGSTNVPYNNVFFTGIVPTASTTCDVKTGN